MSTYKSIFSDGLWSNNVVLSQGLALCPLLAVTSNASNGLGLGMATLFVMVAANLMASTLQNLISRPVRLPINVLMIGTLVTLTDLLLNAYLHSLHKVLGLFVPLIVTNCAILGRVESFASRNRPHLALMDGLAMGLGFTWVLILVGGIREIIGSGTLFANASLLLGSSFEFLEITVIPEYRGYLLLILPPGGFLVLGLVMAGQKLIQQASERARLKGSESCA